MTQISGGSTFRDNSAQDQAFTHSSTPRGHAFVAFPGAPYTHDCAVQSARSALGSQGWSVYARDSDETLTEEGVSEWIASTVASASASASTSPAPTPTLRLMDYDLIDFDSIHPSKSATTSTTALSSSYPIRKALIRKNWLYNSIHAHSVKSSRDTLRHLPRTWNIDVQFADDLDELLIDELYDLNEILQNNEAGGPTTRRWFILKAGMADRGMGIRMFDTLDGLRGILEEFEDDSDDGKDDGEEDDDDDDDDAARGGGTAVSLSQLRHFVIQEYLHPPLLISPPSPSPDTDTRTFRKFHLRAYVLCVGGLQVYLYNEMLALFAPSAYTSPTADSHDARVHLTNTCLHSDGSTTANGNIPDENVHLLSDLCRDGAATATRTGGGQGRALSSNDYTSLLALCKETIGETFEAAAKGSGSTNWMMWENCFEVFGVDLLVSAAAAQGNDEWKVSLLEVNAQPDFAQSGKRLQGVVRELFDKTLQVAVLRQQQGVQGFTLCFDEQLRGGW